MLKISPKEVKYPKMEILVKGHNYFMDPESCFSAFQKTYTNLQQAK